jgi:hypothetical protein
MIETSAACQGPNHQSVRIVDNWYASRGFISAMIEFTVSVEFRIKYVRPKSVGVNYHYYMADDAEQALEFQLEMIEHKDWDINILEVEMFDRFANKWIDQSHVLTSDE